MGKRDSAPFRATETWAVAPLVGFELDWPGQCHDVGRSVCLLAADPSVTKKLAGFLLYSPEPYLVAEASWLLATKYLVPGFAWDGDADERVRWGTHRLHQEIVQGFVTAWNLVKPCDVLAPYIFAAQVEPHSQRIVDVEEAEDYAWFNLQAKHVCKPETLTLADVSTFQEVWAGIAKLREFPEDIQGFAPRDLEFLFESEEIERRTAATRLARALRLFEGGMWLGRLHAFLSFWLALESLYVTSREEVKKQLCHRVGRMLGAYGTYYPQVERLYSVRCNVVHGQSDRIDQQDVTSTYRLCCKSLQKVLTEVDLFRAFTSHTKEDLGYLQNLGP
jgi:hypothetical protein